MFEERMQGCLYFLTIALVYSLPDQARFMKVRHVGDGLEEKGSGLMRWYARGVGLSFQQAQSLQFGNLDREEIAAP